MEKLTSDLVRNVVSIEQLQQPIQSLRHVVHRDPAQLEWQLLKACESLGPHIGQLPDVTQHTGRSYAMMAMFCSNTAGSSSNGNS
jgi:hypothetical protein